jgi:phosphate-selective porin OprO/OprP
MIVVMMCHRALARVCLASAFLLFAGYAGAQVVDPQNVLIRNVHLIAAEAKAEELLVNILIRDNKLEVVSKDAIPVEEGASAIDGREGYVLGNLVVGETPSFIILNQNPRDNFEVLLDTNFFTVFAIHNGRLVSNNLFEVPEEKIKEEEEQIAGRGWMAYTPPPMALPMNYLDTTKWNRWDSKWVSGLFVAGVVLDRMHWSSQNQESEDHVEDLGFYDGGEIRGLRLGAVGTINFEKPWVYTVFGATNAFDKGFEVQQQEDFTMFDYRLDIPIFKNANVSVGNQKEPISLERIMPMTNISMQERTSVSDAFLPSRNFGVVVSGMGESQRVTWAGGVFNNWVNQSGGFRENATQYTGRVTWLPMISEDESNLVHVGLGLRHDDGKNGHHFLTEPEFNKSPTFVNTDVIDSNGAEWVNLEAAWRKGPLWINAEYVDVAVDSPTFGDLDFSGYHASATYTLSGEMRSYNRKSGIIGATPVAKTVNQGGWGAWELGVRYSTIDLTDGLVDGGEMDIWSFGVKWKLTPVFVADANYRYITLDRSGFESSSDGFLIRILLLME